MQKSQLGKLVELKELMPKCHKESLFFARNTLK